MDNNLGLNIQVKLNKLFKHTWNGTTSTTAKKKFSYLSFLFSCCLRKTNTFIFLLLFVRLRERYLFILGCPIVKKERYVSKKNYERFVEAKGCETVNIPFTRNGAESLGLL